MFRVPIRSARSEVLRRARGKIPRLRSRLLGLPFVRRLSDKGSGCTASGRGTATVPVSRKDVTAAAKIQAFSAKFELFASSSSDTSTRSHLLRPRVSQAHPSFAASRSQHGRCRCWIDQPGAELLHQRRPAESCVGRGSEERFGLGWNFSGQGFGVVFSNVMGFPGGWVLCLYPRYH